MDLKAALAGMNPEDDSQWTMDGLPRIDYLMEQTGLDNLTRRAVTQAGPSHTRKTMLSDAAAKAHAAATQEAFGNMVPDVPQPTPEVPPEKGVMGMDPKLVFASYELMEQAQEEIKALNRQDQKEMKRLKDAIDNRSRWAAACDRQMNILRQQGKGPKKFNATRHYLDAQKKRREKQAAAKQDPEKQRIAQAVKDMDTRAPIDKVLANRPRQVHNPMEKGKADG